MSHTADAPAPVPSLYTAIWALVREIPPGRVMTYGQIATLLGTPRAARAVGYAMFFVPVAGGREHEIPWHRVINAKGEISLGGHVDRPMVQRDRLTSEGVVFDAKGRVDLKTYLWWPELSANAGSLTA